MELITIRPIGRKITLYMVSGHIVRARYIFFFRHGCTLGLKFFKVQQEAALKVIMMKLLN